MALSGQRASPASPKEPAQAQPRLRAEPAALPGRQHPAGPQELWLRLQPRARAWALDQYGFRAIIAPSFADIFFNNCFKNGLLPIVLPEATVAQLFDEVAAFPATSSPSIWSARSSCAHRVKRSRSRCRPFRKYCLLNGFDDIGLTLRQSDKIRPLKPSASQPNPGWRTRWFLIQILSKNGLQRLC